MMANSEIPGLTREQNEALNKLLQQMSMRFERKIEELGRRPVNLLIHKEVPRRNQGSPGLPVMVQLGTQRFLYLMYEDGWHSIRIPGGIIPPKEDSGHEPEKTP